MKHRSVRDAFVSWSEGRLAEAKRGRIQAHLDACADCADFYRRMTRLLQSAAPASLPSLEADPHVPARVRAMSQGRAEAAPTLRRRGSRVWLQWSFGAAALAVALAAGAYTGHRAGTLLTARGAVDIAQSDQVSTTLADTYYEAWSQSGFTETWKQWSEGNSGVGQ